ncbi:MAG: hypothetical protein Q4A07_08375 [Coriobacteriales bacterium]|nr:hypothetical protein [Coriobacteriales bacterium]
MQKSNLSKGAILEGYEKGMKQGLADGMKEGLKEGVKQGRADERAAFMDVVASMVRDGTIAMRVASERFGFSEQELMAVI